MRLDSSKTQNLSRHLDGLAVEKLSQIRFSTLGVAVGLTSHCLRIVHNGTRHRMKMGFACDFQKL